MELPESVTKMPPQRLLLIAGAGIAAGLLWRHFSNKQAGATGNPLNPYDSMQGAGNLGAFGSSLEPTNGIDSADRRDVFGSGINLPVAEWVIVGADGKRYLTNGETITPLEGATSAPIPSTPAPPAPAPTQNRQLSPTEQAIWDAIRAGSGKTTPAVAPAPKYTYVPPPPNSVRIGPSYTQLADGSWVRN
jgi:hypothetical protein